MVSVSVWCTEAVLCRSTSLLQPPYVLMFICECRWGWARLSGDRWVLIKGRWAVLRHSWHRIYINEQCCHASLCGFLFVFFLLLHRLPLFHFLFILLLFRFSFSLTSSLSSYYLIFFISYSILFLPYFFPLLHFYFSLSYYFTLLHLPFPSFHYFPLTLMLTHFLSLLPFPSSTSFIRISFPFLFWSYCFHVLVYVFSPSQGNILCFSSLWCV